MNRKHRRVGLLSSRPRGRGCRLERQRDLEFEILDGAGAGCRERVPRRDRELDVTRAGEDAPLPRRDDLRGRAATRRTAPRETPRCAGSTSEIIGCRWYSTRRRSMCSPSSQRAGELPRVLGQRGVGTGAEERLPVDRGTAGHRANAARSASSRVPGRPGAGTRSDAFGPDLAEHVADGCASTGCGLISRNTPYRRRPPPSGRQRKAPCHGRFATNRVRRGDRRPSAPVAVEYTSISGDAA